MTVDMRSRRDGTHEVPTPAALIDNVIAALDRNSGLLADGVRWLGLVPLTMLVDADAWTLRSDARGRVNVQRGVTDEGSAWRMTPEDLDNLMNDQTTVMA